MELNIPQEAQIHLEKIKEQTDKISILDKYIMRQVIEIFIMGIVIFTSIIFASDTFITLIKQITLYGIPFNVALMIVLLNLPQVIVMAIPMSVLFSTVMTLNKLSLSSEITVMRACGIGLNRIAKPIFIFAAVMSLFTFIVNETVVPITNSQSKTLAVWALGQKNIPNGKQNFTFKETNTSPEGGNSIKRLFFVQRCEDNILKNVTVVDFSEKDTLKVIQSQTGKTSPDCSVTINLNSADQGTVTVDGTGQFSKAVSLSPGENIIMITATSLAGKTTSVTREVTYDPDAPVVISIEVDPNPVEAGGQITITVEATDE